MAIFFSWEFVATSLAIMALVNVLKSMARQYTTSWGSTAWFRAYVLAPANSVFGILIALIPGWLPGEYLGHRMIAGIVAGLLSNQIYGIAKRRMGDHFRYKRKDDPPGKCPQSDEER